MKLDRPVATEDTAAPAKRRFSLIRIALPSWRVGSDPWDTSGDSDEVTRDELQSLFGGELTIPKPKFNRISKTKQQMAMNLHLRRAIGE